MKSTKYHYNVLMIKGLFQMMVFIHLLIFIKTKKQKDVLKDPHDDHK